ncbi:MAG: DUF4382 domain-containing protein [Arenibacter latericius]|nr:DUF4382 domain-containing protein [Arenibacter latericius]
MKKNLILFFTIVFLSLAIGCTDNDDAGSDMGRLSVHLTDAPFPHHLVAEANVTVFKIDARNKSKDGETSEENDGSPFVVLMEKEVPVNLLELTNGVTETLVDLEVPVGQYDLVRVYVKGVNVVLTDGTTYDLKVPSGEQTGIKVFIKPGLTVKGGLSSDLLLDFDVSRSFVAKGSANKVDGITGFNFKPVIKASNLSTAGTLTGKVNTIKDDNEVALAGAQISVFAADTLNTTGFSDVDGNYTIMGLDAGDYKIVTELDGYIPSDALEAEITAANKTILDFTLEPESTQDGN